MVSQGARFARVRVCRAVSSLAVAWVVILSGCDVQAEPTDRPAASRSGSPEETPEVGVMYERDIVFLGQEEDSLVAVPFAFSSVVSPDGVDRSVRAWLYRDGSWDPFHEADWETERTRAPWRVLPHGPIALVMGLEDGLEAIVFEEGPRQMDVRLGGGNDPWSGPLGETLSLQSGQMAISGTRVDGMALELARTWRSRERPPGDWFFLASGDSAGLVLLDSSGPDQGPRFRAWARVWAENLLWTEVELDRVESRPFEPARREVPSRWLLRAGGVDDGLDAAELTGELWVVSSQMEAGTGDGPLLPVSGLFRVAGVINIEGRSAPVEGLARHRQW